MTEIPAWGMGIGAWVPVEFWLGLLLGALLAAACMWRACARSRRFTEEYMEFALGQDKKIGGLLLRVAELARAVEEAYVLLSSPGSHSLAIGVILRAALEREEASAE